MVRLVKREQPTGPVSSPSSSPNPPSSSSSRTHNDKGVQISTFMDPSRVAESAANGVVTHPHVVKMEPLTLPASPFTPLSPSSPIKCDTEGVVADTIPTIYGDEMSNRESSPLRATTDKDSSSLRPRRENARRRVYESGEVSLEDKWYRPSH